MLTTQQAADKLRNAGFTYKAKDVAELAKQRVFPSATRASNIWQIPEEDVDDFIEQLSQQPGQRQTMHRSWNRIFGWFSAIVAAIIAIIGFNGGFKDTIEMVQIYGVPLYSRIFGVERKEIPTIDQVVIGRNDTEFKFQIIIHNPYDKQIAARYIGLEYSEKYFCPGAAGSTYKVSNQVTIFGREKDRLLFTTSVQDNSGGLAGYPMKGTGIYDVAGCDHTFFLSFPAPVVIDKDTYSSIFVVVPRKFRVNNPVDKYSEDITEQSIFELAPQYDRGKVSHLVAVDIDIGQSQHLLYSVTRPGTP